ncbi:neuroblastoma-amplified sequence, partial [Tremellales sp. Uapishka_1]
MADLVASPTASTSALPSSLLDVPPSSLTPEIVTSTLSTLSDTEVLSTCSALIRSRTIDDAKIVRLLVDSGLERSGVEDEGRPASEQHEIFQRAKRRLETYEALLPEGEGGVDIDDPWTEDEPEDPWAEDAERPPSKQDVEDATHPSIPLSTFLVDPLLVSATTLATDVNLSALKILFLRHPDDLFPYRFAILEAVPGWVSPAELERAGLLPSLADSGVEKAWEGMNEGELSSASDRSGIPAARASLLSSEELSEWYTSRITDLDTLGLVDVQLSWVQHCASLGIPALDGLGEDLSLLSRLIYDSNLPMAQLSKWTLATWRTSSEDEIIQAYLSGSTPETIVADIRRLVLPYLYVLESRKERLGTPDPDLIERYLHQTILGLPLYLVLSALDASKATLAPADRLIRNDLNVARIALACLYGSDQKDGWGTMSAIFECLPVWDVSGGDVLSDREATATTLDSIATFVRPTTALP